MIYNLYDHTLNAKNGVPMQLNTTVEKQCSVCKQILPISKFRSYKKQSGSIGYRGSCRECEMEQNRQRQQQKKAQLTIEKDDTFRFMEMYKKVKGG